MKTIWKYELEVCDSQVIKMPAGSQILTVQKQAGIVQLWALVYTKMPQKDRIIRIYGTGHNITDNVDLKYISTFQFNNGELVFHVFEEVNVQTP